MWEQTPRIADNVSLLFIEKCRFALNLESYIIAVSQICLLKKIYQKLFAEIDQIPSTLSGGYYPAIDGLRGVAILMVILVHFGTNLYSFRYHISLDSRAGVHTFFILSGFLITTLLLKEKVRDGGINLKYFYLRRALRILPLLFLFLLVLFVLDLIFKLRLTAFDFAGAVLFIKNLPVSGSYYTAHLWSLAVEGQFYLTFPVLLMLSTKNYTIVTIALVIVAPLIAIGGYYHIPIFYHNHYGASLSKLCRYSFWKGPINILMGSLAAILVFKQVVLTGRTKLNYFLSFGLLLIALVIRVNDFLFYQQYICEYISNILITCVVAIVVCQRDFLADILSSRFLVRIGVISYSVYIWQQLFVGDNTWEPWLRRLHGIPLWLLIILKLCFVFIIASISYKYENWFLQVKGKFNYNSMRRN